MSELRPRPPRDELLRGHYPCVLPLVAHLGSAAAAQQRPLSRVTRTTYARLAGHFLGLLALPFGKIAADISELLWAP